MFILALIRIQSKLFGVSYDAFKDIPPKWGLVRRGHHRILSKVSNVILTDLTGQTNTWVKIFSKFIVLLKKNIHETVTEKTLDALYNFIIIIGKRLFLINSER